LKYAPPGTGEKTPSGTDERKMVTERLDELRKAGR
jgi:hypothetical protein